MPQPVVNLVVASHSRGDLYERIRRIRKPNFEGLSLVVDEWPPSLQVILDYMNFINHENVHYTSFVLKKDARYWETMALRRDVNDMS